MDNDKGRSEKYIELNAFLKIHTLATTGGQAKNMIRSGNVTVNGVTETRNKKKLFSGDEVVCSGENYIVHDGELKVHHK